MNTPPPPTNSTTPGGSIKSEFSGRRQAEANRDLGPLVSRLMVVMISLITAAGCPKLPEPKAKAVSVLVVMLDQSTPMATERRCAELSARVRDTLRRPGVKRLDLLVLGSGDQRTAYEPIALVPWKEWKPDGALFEHPDKAELSREGWISEVRATCENAVRAVKQSSLHLAVTRGTESLRSRCAELERRRARCRERLLAVHSDLRENAEVRLRTRLRNLSDEREGKKPRRESEAGIARIDTTDIETKVCGVADTSLGPREKLVQPGVVVEAWQQILGAPASAFDAVCTTDDRAGAPPEKAPR